MKIVVNKCYGGFGLSQEAYLWLHKHGIPVVPYYPESRGKDGLYKDHPKNKAIEKKHGKRVIFDRDISPLSRDASVRKLELMMKESDMFGRYWDGWTRDSRTDPLIVQCVEALGDKASKKPTAELKVVEIPDGVEWEIDEYDGIESVHEKHRVW